MKKFSYLWENDDYASSWNTLFLSQQGTLTPELQSWINRITLWNNDIYLLCLFLSAVYGFILLRRKDSGNAQILILLFIGTVILHMILESQNRYHYYILPVFMILSSLGIIEIYRDIRSRSVNRDDRPDR
jgi:hypothetical protein